MRGEHVPWRLRPHPARLRRVAVRVSAVLALLTLAACAPDGATPGGSGHWEVRAERSSAPTFAGAVTTTPADGAAGVSVLDPVLVSVTDATLESVSVVNPTGRQVSGETAADGRGWRSTEPLGYGKTYTITATAADANGLRSTRTSTFTTVKPTNLTLPYLRANAGLLLADRKTFGVGQPIVVHFDEQVPDRAAAERALQVTTTPHVAGAWHWYTSQEVHWRPQQYWQPGTKVTIAANVYGVDLGGGLYGQQDVSASFTIGDKKIAIADDDTLRIQVYVNDALVRTALTSMGKHATAKSTTGKDLDLRTRSGVHVVLGTARSTRMTGASWGLADGYDTVVNYTTHLSYQGEYIHEATWNRWKHGKQDDSHGCLNVGTADAVWFMNNFIPGDVVEVRNTGIQLGSMDGLTDWNMSWDRWLQGSVLGAS